MEKPLAWRAPRWQEPGFAGAAEGAGMTGFAAWIAPAGAAPDAGVAARVAAALAPLGPDRQGEWQHGRALLSHALLATSEHDPRESQPLTLDGRHHVVADARIDGRADLLAQLRQHGCEIAGDAPDSALILHAFSQWGEDCVRHLIGDFAFAIWDAETGTLFAARDQFGVVPLGYAVIDGAFVLANALQPILADPAFDRTLAPLAIADFLMFGYGFDPAASAFRNVTYLPPAHCLTWADGETRIRRYWSPPEPDFADWSRLGERELREIFETLLRQSVRDRTRGGAMSIAMSGGMDSTLLAGLALSEGAADMRAYCFGSDWLVPDHERHWAWRAARHLGLPLTTLAIERAHIDPPGGRWRAPPEPRLMGHIDPYDLIGEHMLAHDRRVLLTGMGGDVITGGGLWHWGRLVEQRRFAELAGEARAYWRHFRRRPPLRGAWERSQPATPPPMLVPIHPELMREHRLDQRWADAAARMRSEPRAMMASQPFWSAMFARAHPSSSGQPIRLRHPFFDVRLVEAARRLPPTPWQFGKTLLRGIGSAFLAPDIVKRPKMTFSINAEREAALHGLAPWVEELRHADELQGWVDRARLADYIDNLAARPDLDFTSCIARPADLRHWLGLHG